MARCTTLIRHLPVLVLAAAALTAGVGCSSNKGEPQASDEVTQLSFDSPQDALRALRYLASSHDRAYGRELFGPEVDQLSSGDAAVDHYERELLAAAISKRSELVTNADGTVDIITGERGVAFPVPLVQHEGRWLFDTPEGLERMIDIRVGYYELKTLAALRAITRAQEVYRSTDADGNGVRDYAANIMSSPGKKDGLYWPTSPGETNSPLGAFYVEGEVPQSESLGYNGYFYRMMTTSPQTAGSIGSASTPPAARDPSREGFLVIAYPAMYDQTGVMTFYMGTDGVVYQKDLGPDATREAGKMNVMRINLGEWEVTND